MPLGGFIVGAIAGEIGGKLSDFGINAGSSAIFMPVRKVTMDKVEPELGKFGGKILRTSLSKEAEAKLQAALDEASKPK